MEKLITKSFRRLLDKGVHRGFITYEELGKSLGKRHYTQNNIEEAFLHIFDNKVSLVEKRSDYRLSKKKDSTLSDSEKSKETEKSDDPIRMYLREMGGVELLSREGEIAIAKRIEAGKEYMINGLFYSKKATEILVFCSQSLLILLFSLFRFFGRAREERSIFKRSKNENVTISLDRVQIHLPKTTKREPPETRF